jgi:mRNA-degrading endonuclease toxin of MazEF toxin-antitoxin module
LAQYDIYPNPGAKKADIQFLVVIQNDHISSRTGASVVIPLHANMLPVEVMAPLMSSEEIFAIENVRLRNPVGSLNLIDRSKIKPAIDKVIGDY